MIAVKNYYGKNKPEFMYPFPFRGPLGSLHIFEIAHDASVNLLAHLFRSTRVGVSLHIPGALESAGVLIQHVFLGLTSRVL